MLFPGQVPTYGFTYDNWGAAPSTTVWGTSVVPGVSNAEGAWTQVASAANIAQDIYFIEGAVGGGALSAVAKNQLLDIGVDPAGGTSYTAVASNLVCGEIGTSVGNFLRFSLPLFIKAGSSVAVRVQGSHTVAGTVRVGMRFYGKPSSPETFPVGSFVETLGTITNSNGTSFTPGNAAWGAWASLGTLVKPCWWWNLGVQIDNAAASNHTFYAQLGVGNATNKQIVTTNLIGISSTENISHHYGGGAGNAGSYFPAPAGSIAYVRAWNSAAPVTGYNATAWALGG